MAKVVTEFECEQVRERQFVKKTLHLKKIDIYDALKRSEITLFSNM